MKSMNNIVIVRYGELALKSPSVRNWYEKVLMSNISSMLDQRGIQYEKIFREWGRIFIETSDLNAAQAASDVFGVVSSSFTNVIDTNISNIATKCAQISQDFINEGQSFAIRVRRSGNHQYTSRDVAVACGDAVWQRLLDIGKTPVVNLTKPDKEIFVEVRQKQAFVFTHIVNGVGGLPLGTQGKMISLISGGIDSPVAAWLMMKRGVTIIPVYCSNEPYADNSTEKRAVDTIRVLQQWSPGQKLKVYKVPHGKSLKCFIENCSRNQTCVLCKRTMYRIAYEIMKKEDASGIITGSSLGQVASQTAANMYAELYGLSLPLYHPLISYDKSEIINLARKIGSYDISVSNVTCCSAVPDKPQTHAVFDSLLQEENKIKIEELINYAVSNIKILTII